MVRWFGLLPVLTLSGPLQALEAPPPARIVKRAAATLPGPRAHAAVEAHEARRVREFVQARYGERAASRFTPLLVSAGRRHGIPPLLLAKVAHRESSFRTHVSNRGCHGLMQVAAFHFRPGEDPFSAGDNLNAGARILAGYKKRFRTWPQALTAYNFGPGATASRGLTSSRYARQVLAGR